MQKLKEYELDRFSPSMISCYLDCPKLFYYKYVCKINLPQKQLPLIFGSAVHKAIEEMYKGDLTPHHHFLESIETDKHKLVDDELNDMPEILKLGYEMIDNYLEYHPTLDKLYELAAGSSEWRVRRKLIHPYTGEESSIPFSGVLDRLTDSKRIIEYKTAKQKWDPTTIHTKPQNLLYNLWYYSEFGDMAEETVYIILLKKFKAHKHDQVVQVITSNVTMDEMASAFEETEHIISKIRQGTFECSKSCAFFSHKELKQYENALLLQDYYLI